MNKNKIEQLQESLKYQEKIDKAENARDAFKAKFKSEEKKAKALVKRNKELQDQFDTVMGLNGKIKPLKIKTRKRSGVSESTMLALASDWHIGETVTYEATNGKNRFNLEIADERITKFFQKIAELTDIERTATSINDLVLWLGGDLMNGYLRDEDLETNSLNPRS